MGFFAKPLMFVRKAAVTDCATPIDGVNRVQNHAGSVTGNYNNDKMNIVVMIT